MRSGDPSSVNLFSRLFSYSPREGRTPLEDFCTEALAWCLLNSSVFRQRFFKLIGKESWDTEIDVDTQYSYEAEEDDDETEGANAGRFDMLICPKVGKEFVIVVESKTTSAFGKNQIDKYRAQLNSDYYLTYGTRIILTLTNSPNSPQFSDPHIEHLHVTWPDVVGIMGGAIGVDEKSLNKEVLSWFSNFLKQEGLGPMVLSEIDPSFVRQVAAVGPCLNELREILYKSHNEDAFRTIFGKKKTVRLDVGKAGRNWWGMYSPWKRGSPIYYVGFGLIQQPREALLMWVEVTVPGKYPSSLVPPTLHEAFEKAKEYKTDDDKWLNNDRDYKNKESCFVFVQALDSEYTNTPTKIKDWFTKTLTEAQKMVGQVTDSVTGAKALMK